MEQSHAFEDVIGGARTFAVATDVAGRAGAGLTPTGTGALQITARASFQARVMTKDGHRPFVRAGHARTVASLPGVASHAATARKA